MFLRFPPGSVCYLCLSSGLISTIHFKIGIFQMIYGFETVKNDKSPNSLNILN